MPRRQQSPKARLRKELESLLDQVDEEGLIFLIRQAETIIHNLQVDRINAEIARLAKERAGKPARETRRARGAGAEEAGDGLGEGEVSIEEGVGRTTFIVQVGGARKVFSLAEMRALARLAHAAGDDADGARRLFAWLQRNRGDVLLDLGVRSAAHPALALVHRAIRSRYRPRADAG